MSLLATIPTGNGCPACGLEATKIYYLNPKADFRFRLCGRCGHIYRKLPDGKSRNMTPAETLEMRARPDAQTIRELQAKKVRNMIG